MPVAGLIAGSPALVGIDAFDETAAYQASYSSATDRCLDPISAIVYVSNKEQARKEIAAWMASNVGFPPGSEKTEVIHGHQVTRVERDTTLIVAWSSGTRMIGTEFNRYAGAPRFARAVEAAAQGWPELIRSYLRKYPQKIETLTRILFQPRQVYFLVDIVSFDKIEAVSEAGVENLLIEWALRVFFPAYPQSGDGKVPQFHFRVRWPIQAAGAGRVLCTPD